MKHAESALLDWPKQFLFEMESSSLARRSPAMLALASFQLKLAAAVIGGVLLLASYPAEAVKSVSLAWDASAGEGVVGYTVRYGTNSRQYSDFLVVGLSTTATVPNLVEGVSYFFAVSAYTSAGLESDLSDEIQYTVPNVPPTDSRPTLSPIGNLVINEDAGQQSVTLSGISAGGALELPGIGVIAVSSDPSLIPDPSVVYTSPNATGSLLFAPRGNSSGQATITVTINNFQPLGNLLSRTFTVTVNPVNDPPTLNAVSDVTLPLNAGPQTIILSGIGSGAENEVQPLMVQAASSNRTLISDPSIRYSSGETTATLTLTPEVGVAGTATINVTVSDFQTAVIRSFTVMVGNPSFNTTYLEAESGAIVAPMISVSDANASNGRYVYTLNDNLGTVSFQVSLAQAGDYTVWCRTLSRNSGSDSFFVSINNGTEETYATAQNTWSANWRWTRVTTGWPLAPRLFSLSQGVHTLVFRGREKATLLDALYITNDRNFVPYQPVNLVVTPVSSPSRGMQIGFQASAGLRYEIQASEDLTFWTSLWLSPVTAASQTLSFLDTAETSLGRRFYRVQIP